MMTQMKKLQKVLILVLIEIREFLIRRSTKKAADLNIPLST